MNGNRYHLAVDIGASGGRHILGGAPGGKLELREIYRFPNGTIKKNGHLCWDSDALYSHILRGLRICGEFRVIPETAGIDAWGVDFALLDRSGRLLGDTVAYRDGRTGGVDTEIERLLPFAELYARTGIQKQPFNTLYQLAALKRDAPEQLNKAESLLMLPDYFGYLLTGVKKQEYTNATTTALVCAETKRWDDAAINQLGFPKRLFGPLSQPATVLGGFSGRTAGEAGYDCTVVLPATHDTGSAFLAVPAPDEYAVYISSGTWSLLGVETDRPITTEAARRANFTNEGGYGGRYRFLKNIMGLWMLQSVRRELGDTYSYPELSALAREAADTGSVVDVNDAAFLAPDSMTEAVRQFCAGTGQPVPNTAGELLQVVYRSLAKGYAEAIRELSGITGKQYRRINIVGGGCRDAYLNRLTADAAGLPVIAGPVEASAIGNLMAQMLATGEFTDLADARAAVLRSFDVAVFRPTG